MLWGLAPFEALAQPPRLNGRKRLAVSDLIACVN
jgi:hypothetical protein